MNRNIVINLLGLFTLTIIFNQHIIAQGNSHGGIDKTRLSVQERVVRYAYRKVYTYGLAGNLDRNKQRKQVPDEIAAKNSIRFELNNFQIGPIEQIKNVRFFDLATPPNGEIIELATKDSFINDRKNKRVEAFFSLTAQWVKGQYASGMDKNFTLEEVMRYQPARFSQFESYAVFEVTVFLDGKTRTYRAFALFPNVNRSSKRQKPEFFDNVAGFGGAITNIFKEFKEPKGFVRQKLNKNKAFQAKNSSQPVSSPDQVEVSDQNDANSFIPKTSGSYFSKVNYKKNSKGGCFLYDVMYGLSCSCIGVSPLLDYQLLGDPGWDWTLLDGAPDDVMCILDTVQTPEVIGGGGGQPCERRYTVRPGVQGYKRDKTYHLTGEHFGNVILSGSCFQDEQCNNICRVEEQLPPYVGETADDDETFYYHQGAQKSQERVDQGGKDVELKCDRTVGYSFSRCPVWGCNIAVTISVTGPVGGASVQVSGGDLWNDSFTLSNQCKNGQ